MDTPDRSLDRWTEQVLRPLEPDAAWQPDAAAGLAKLRAGAPRSARVARWPLAIAATLVVCFSIPMVGGARGLAARCLQACVDLFSRSGATPPVAASSGVSEPFIEPGRRRTAPGFAFKDVGGRDVRSSSWAGQVVLLNFWATWCGPCKAEIPWFSDFASQYGARGLAIAGLAMDEDSAASVRTFAGDLHIDYPVGLGDDQVSRAWGGVDSLPTTFLIDRRGRIAARFVGLTGRSAYEAVITRLLAEK